MEWEVLHQRRAFQKEGAGLGGGEFKRTPCPEWQLKTSARKVIVPGSGGGEQHDERKGLRSPDSLRCQMFKNKRTLPNHAGRPNLLKGAGEKSWRCCGELIRPL